MRNSIEISKDLLTWVLGQLDPEKTSPNIIEILIAWEKGDKIPTFNKIQEVSRATGIPLGYFLLKTPPNEDLTFVNYRTVDSISLQKPSRNLITTMHDMELVQDWMHDYMHSNNMAKNSYVGSLEKANFTDMVNTIRKILDLPIDWFSKVKTTDESFKTLRNLISNTGVIVMMSGIVRNNTKKSLSIDEFRAFALIDEYAPLIFINNNDSVNGKLFSLLHEFVHIGLGKNSLYNDRYSDSLKVNKEEVICNAIAAEILVPQDLFIKKWNSISKKTTNKEETINILAGIFKCGATVIARKALDNKYIDYSLYSSIANKAVQLYKKSKRKSDGGNFYNTLSSRIDSNFINYLIGSVEQGYTLYSEAYRLTNTNRNTFKNLKEVVEGGIYG